MDVGRIELPSLVVISQFMGDHPLVTGEAVIGDLHLDARAVLFRVKTQGQLLVALGVVYTAAVV